MSFLKTAIPTPSIRDENNIDKAEGSRKASNWFMYRLMLILPKERQCLTSFVQDCSFKDLIG